VERHIFWYREIRSGILGAKDVDGVLGDRQIGIWYEAIDTEGGRFRMVGRVLHQSVCSCGSFLLQ